MEVEKLGPVAGERKQPAKATFLMLQNSGYHLRLKSRNVGDSFIDASC